MEIHTEDTASILLRFEGGARGSVNISQLSPGRKNSLAYQIDGSSSAVAWDSEQPEQLWIGHRDRPNELLLRNPALMNARGRRGGPRCPAATWRASPTRSARVFTAIYDDVLAGRPIGEPALRHLRRRPRGDAHRGRGPRELPHGRLGEGRQSLMSRPTEEQPR